MSAFLSFLVFLHRVAWGPSVECKSYRVSSENPERERSRFPKAKIQIRFWPGTQAGENVPGWPVCPRVYR